MPDIDAAFLLQFLACIAAGLVIWNQARKAFGKDNTPQPLVVEWAKKFVSHEDHEALSDRVDKNHAELKGEIKELKSEGKQDRATLYDKLNAVLQEVAAQRKADELTQAALSRMEIKIDRINERKADKS